MTNKRKGLSKVATEAAVYDDSMIRNQDPMDILMCDIRAIYRNGTLTGKLVTFLGEDIMADLRKKFNKKTDPVSVVIEGFKIVGRRNNMGLA